MFTQKCNSPLMPQNLLESNDCNCLRSEVLTVVTTSIPHVSVLTLRGLVDSYTTLRNIQFRCSVMQIETVHFCETLGYIVKRATALLFPTINFGLQAEVSKSLIILLLCVLFFINVLNCHKFCEMLQLCLGG
jgi:hypothetical protein